MIERIAGADEAALAAFYQRFAPLLYGIAFRIMKDEKDAEDVFQEGFVYIWRKAVAYNPQMLSPFSWAVLSYATKLSIESAPGSALRGSSNARRRNFPIAQNGTNDQRRNRSAASNAHSSALS